ncbi:c-type cytochrome [Altererythrobacter sediminis]|uniref:C-type cytochrome n=2 Tax=Allopontixanthobacter sediminis TaxID=1689985 RepID=A0A845B2S9_9SPHN|nr:c-type cytochrome [Allopontixanthobacter sediminis]
MAGAAVLAVMTAACSGGESEPAEPAATSEPAAPAAPAAVETTAAADPAAAAGAPADQWATTDGIAYASLTGDAAAGKVVFAQCRSCHVTEPGVNKTGPSLAGIVGRTAGSVDGYNYSPANANSGITWTEEHLYAYLENPQRVVPKTKMIFPGLRDAQKRADVIAYLKNPT